ncbi:MAG TPA: LamG domain-containing protein, partial [Bacteroidia bacterium]|nr:LamG domain-containing protein [Bacteroidia bacterium]
MKTSITYYLIIFQIIFGYQISKAQSSNALAFDGSNDLVTIPNASALISGSNAISLACWVYPTNPTPNTSSYDGIVGIRNNTDADFYILHFTANTVECRFRNSNGNNFDLIGTGIVLNAWQHLAFTYDGSMLRYYRNGVLTDSLPANGDITLNNESLFIGGTPYQGNQFLLEGRVDEVTFWDKAINGTDLNCLLNGSADTSDANLLLYYKFNQG